MNIEEILKEWLHKNGVDGFISNPDANGTCKGCHPGEHGDFLACDNIDTAECLPANFDDCSICLERDEMDCTQLEIDNRAVFCMNAIKE